MLTRHKNPCKNNKYFSIKLWQGF